MSETNQNELQLRIMYPPKCGYCYYRFFISTNAMSIIVITPGYNLIPINNFVTSFFLCRTLSIKYSFTEIHCRININGNKTKTNSNNVNIIEGNYMTGNKTKTIINNLNIDSINITGNKTIYTSLTATIYLATKQKPLSTI